MTLDNELAGILVVSLEQAVAAPYCGLLLADAGARVIKVERPEGDFARGYDSGADGQSAIFAWLNRGKESVSLDLRAAPDRDLLLGVLRRADVFLSNLAPGALGRLGLHRGQLRAANPRLITCAISGYGDTGDAAGRKAYDFLVQGESGLCAVTGTPLAPARVGIPIADISTGLTAYAAILRALIRRGQTGEGAELKLSMFDVLADWMNMPLMGHRYMGGAPGRMGLTHSFVAPYGAYRAGDGGLVLLSVQSNREFAAFCAQVLGQPELAQDPRFAENPDRYANRAALDTIVTAAFAGLDAAAVLARLDAARIANARLNEVADLSRHSCLNETSADFGGFEVRMAALPIPGGGGTSGEVPTLDQHGPAIRAEFGATGEAV